MEIPVVYRLKQHGGTRTGQGRPASLLSSHHRCGRCLGLSYMVTPHLSILADLFLSESPHPYLSYGLD